MDKWKLIAIKELSALMMYISNDILGDPEVLAQKLRQLAFQVEKMKRRN